MSHARRVTAAMAVIYFVWGSSYIALRVMVETIPPWLGGAFRLLLSGSLLLGFLALRSGARSVRPTARELVALRSSRRSPW